MSEIKDGGPAFPTFLPVERYDHNSGRCVTTHQPEGGATLRDYFAAKALAGMLSNVNVLGADASCGRSLVNQSEQGLAQDAYDIADAMLRAREAK